LEPVVDLGATKDQHQTSVLSEGEMGTDNEHEDTLRRIKRGLVGYISYLAACEMNSAFSEYVLYEPILRILTARGYEVQCEFPLRNHELGDHPRIDFFGIHPLKGKLAIEVKWKKKTKPRIQKDLEKLRTISNRDGTVNCFLCVFGRRSYLQDWTPDDAQFTEFGDGVYAEFGQTRYGCRVFQLVKIDEQ
jgi:hypothetical protein